MIETSEGLQVDQAEGTNCLPQFEYRFNPTKPKSMGLGEDYFPSQRRKLRDDDPTTDLRDCICSICEQTILVTDEYIRLLDCNHVYHRICLIHSIV